MVTVLTLEEELNAVLNSMVAKVEDNKKVIARIEGLIETNATVKFIRYERSIIKSPCYIHIL